MSDIHLVNKAADNIRILSASMVEKAKSGHPGGAMGGADFINILYHYKNIIINRDWKSNSISKKNVENLKKFINITFEEEQKTPNVGTDHLEGEIDEYLILL